MDDLVSIPEGVAGTLSPLVVNTPGLARLLRVERIAPLGPWTRVDSVLGWGRKANAEWAAAYARGRGVPFFRLEDGFLRSVGLGAEGHRGLSVVVDDLGIYYDSTQPSRLERLLASDDPRLSDTALLGRARAAIRRIRRHGLSKYNLARRVPVLRQEGVRNVLVVDQVGADLSLRYGGVALGTPDAMLRAAIRENPDARLWIKGHPARGHSVLGEWWRDSRLHEVPEDANPVRLLEQMDHVYVMTSLLGFEALLCGCHVTVFGTPFYAGWGLTDDRGPVPARRGRTRTLDELFVGAYLLYSRYVDPAGNESDLESTLATLAGAAAPLEA